MKRFSRFIMGSSGFILLHVLFIIAILFLIVTGSIFSYRNEVYITDTQVEHIQVESLFQMARLKYVEEQMEYKEILQAVTYNFPNGHVEITISHFTEAYRKLQFNIQPFNQDYAFSINHLIHNDIFQQ